MFCTLYQMLSEVIWHAWGDGALVGSQVEDCEGAVAAAAEAVAGGLEADFEAQLRTKAGERLWVQVQLRPVRGGGSAAAENLVRPRVARRV